LLGVAAFVARKRQKEISIRKTVGATVYSIIMLLSRDFLVLVAIALLIAFPLSGLLMERWLQGFAYHINFGVGDFLMAGIAIVLMAGLSVSFQSVKAALANPVKSLSGE
jgi:putative ABC transport system permease protein